MRKRRRRGRKEKTRCQNQRDKVVSEVIAALRLCIQSKGMKRAPLHLTPP